MKIISSSDLPLNFFDNTDFENIDSVKLILEDVKKRKDLAVREYSKKFDNLELENFELSKEDIKNAYASVDSKTIDALRFAANNIRLFAQNQLKCITDFEINDNGNILGQRIVPIEKVGCYVPGGRYPLPSTALMTVIPAKVAGVSQVILCSPKINPATVVAADIAGADRIFNLGGVQAIGAMAYGTETIPKVDKIVGPGNQYVAAAKKEVFGVVGIDFIAGPSEVLVIADESANPDFIAADLLAQAEHDPSARAELITTSLVLANSVVSSLNNQLSNLKTKEIASESIDKNGAIIIVSDINEAIKISNSRAPEHLELQIENSEKIIPLLKNYGSLFIGQYSAEVFGDYCSGPNHTLPTNGCARYNGGLSVHDFVKILTYQKIAKENSKEIIAAASQLADIEGLFGHKNAADIRG
jgi:histidinol dehydrogenase